MADNKIQVLLEVDDRGTASLQRFGRTVAQTGKDGERAFTGMSTASSNLARGVASLAASYASLQSVRALISIADQYTQLEGRLRLVTASTAELAAVETQLYAVAQQTRRHPRRPSVTPTRATAEWPEQSFWRISS